MTARVNERRRAERPDRRNSRFSESQLRRAKWVKAVFGKKESMWVKVLEVREGRITGMLDNEPVHVDMRLGQRVTLRYDDVVDIMTP
jgi:uncharacterized protein YegJ (DUF2314 family)